MLPRTPILGVKWLVTGCQPTGKLRKSAMTDNLPRLLTEDEAAAYLGINSRTLARLRLAGKIEYVRISERRFRYLESQLLTYLKIKNDLAFAKVYIAPAGTKSPVQRRKNLPIVVEQPMFPKPRRRRSHS